MAKIFLQDVVPNGKRSIRNIPLPGNKTEPTAEKEAVAGNKAGKKTPTRKPKPEPETKPKQNLRRPATFIAAVIVSLVLVYAITSLFVSATVRIIPKKVDISLNATGTAAVLPNNLELGYTAVTLSREKSMEVRATGQEKIERQATGKIIVYNDYSSAPQKLVGNTRFETPNGLIFRIKDSISVPGRKTVNGTAIPGSVTVTVYADKPGEQYNVGLSDFTIPGFIGNDKRDKITAKSAPDSPIAGGFVGSVMKISPTDASAAKVSIEAQLRSELQSDLRSQIPDSHVLFHKAYVFNFEELPQDIDASSVSSTSTPANAVVSEKGSIHGILFVREQLSKYFAKQIPEVGESDVLISNLDSLGFSFDGKDGFKPTANEDVTFKLSGDAEFIWKVDKMAVAKSLAGQKRTRIKDILKDFESVDGASVAIRPFWFLNLPKDSSKIQIKIETLNNVDE